METFRFKCPRCEKVLEIPSSLQGKDCACPECQSVINVPFQIPAPNREAEDQTKTLGSPDKTQQEVGQSASDSWCVRHYDTEYGPFPAKELIERMKGGEFPPSALARRQGLEEWKPITQHRELTDIRAHSMSKADETSHPNVSRSNEDQGSPGKGMVGRKEIAVILATVVVVMFILYRDKLPSGRELLQATYLLPAHQPASPQTQGQSDSSRSMNENNSSSATDLIDINSAAEIVRQQLSDRMSNRYSAQRSGLPGMADWIFFDKSYCRVTRHEIRASANQVYIDLEFTSTTPMMLEIISKGIPTCL